MPRRQTAPSRWLIVSGELDPSALAAVRRLPRGSGILLLSRLKPRDERRLRILAGTRGLSVASEDGMAARVHDMRELRQALLRRTPLILLSPMHPTATHPDWPRLPRMRGAALARAGGRRLLALGGMNERRYAKVAPLGFIGWAGISAFRI